MTIFPPTHMSGEPDIQKAGSLGMQLVSTIAEQLDARLVIQSHEGTSFELTFSAGA